MTISMDSEKAPDKTQHLFTIKTLKKLQTEGNHLNLTKAMYEKSTASTILMAKNQNLF